MADKWPVENAILANDVPQLRTPGVIASELDAPISRVLYLLRKLNIRPIGRAGVLRLYDRKAVEIIRAELQSAKPS
jgi:hypothetical protein